MSQTREQKILKAYASGMAVQTLTAQFQCSLNTVMKLVRAAGLPLRRPAQAKAKGRDRAKLSGPKGSAICSCCGEPFTPYTDEGQRCATLCRVCWHTNSRGRKALP